jgi:hypothetical protein
MTIVISSTDSYQDCWFPFFSLFEKFIDNVNNIDVFLITDNIIYDKHKFVKTIATSKDGIIMPWADRMFSALSHIKDKSFLLLMDDYFLYSKINIIDLVFFDTILNNDSKLGCLKIVGHESSKILSCTNKNINTISKLSAYRLSLQPTLWKKEYLKQILVPGENPWQFEILGSFRSLLLNKSLVVISNYWLNKNKVIYETFGAGGIKKGGWLKSEHKKIEKILGEKIISSRNFYSLEKNKLALKVNLFKNVFFDRKILILNIKFIFRNF